MLKVIQGIGAGVGFKTQGTVLPALSSLSLTPFLTRKPSCQNRKFSLTQPLAHSAESQSGTGLHRQRGHYWASGKMGYLCPWLRTYFTRELDPKSHLF